MKSFVLSLSALALFTSALAQAECPSVDEVIQNSKNGYMAHQTEFDFSFSSAIASATLCQIEASGFSMCAARLGLIEEILASARAMVENGALAEADLQPVQAKQNEIRKSCP